MVKLHPTMLAINSGDEFHGEGTGRMRQTEVLMATGDDGTNFVNGGSLSCLSGARDRPPLKMMILKPGDCFGGSEPKL